MAGLRARLQPPSPRAHVVPRPGPRARIRSCLEDHALVWVLGTAGAGKTTAVADAVADLPCATAWLTLDTTDAEPGRLLLHLEEALDGIAGRPGPAGEDTRAAGGTDVEAAARLAEGLGTTPLVLVLDEVDRVVESDSARLTLSAFLRALDPAARAVLVSRRDVPLVLGSARPFDGVGCVTETDLALDAAEAGQVLERLGWPGGDPAEVVRATGGWVAGVLFEARRSPGHVHGGADPLHGYLSTEIMAGLPEGHRRFLEATSLLAEVTPGLAARLGQRRARAIMADLRSRHVPACFTGGGEQMRCHPRFREFLRWRLEARDEEEVASLHGAHGRLLLDLGRVEDAVEAFLAAGDLDAAEAAGAEAMDVVLGRGDVALAAGWLRAFRRATLQHSEALTRAELAVSLEGEAWAAGAMAAERLLGMLRATAAGEQLDPDLAGIIGTCYLHVGRFEDALAVIGHARPGPAREAWSVTLAIDIADRPEHYRDRPAERGGTLDGLLHRHDLIHGRFPRLLEADPVPCAAARSSRIAALGAVGRHDEALALLEGWSEPERSPGMTRNAIDLLADSGRTDEAFALLERGRVAAARSSPYCLALHHLQAAALALRVRGDAAAARAALDRVAEDPGAARRRRVVEQVDLWHGLACLLDDDAALAATHLRRAVATMLDWDHQFFLPSAGVYLAEVEWRLGHEGAADTAADHALAAARIQGSDHLLLRALHEYPAVLTRRLDAEPVADSPWHALGRVLSTERPRIAAAPATGSRLQEFGTPALSYLGRSVALSLRRSSEVLARLAAAGGALDKTTLLRDLFDDTDERARSYLRQSLKRLRDALVAAGAGEGALESGGERVQWVSGRLTSDSIEFESAARLALRLRDRPGLEAAERALAVVGGGEYFPGSRGDWVVTRRVGLHRLALDVRLGAAGTALGLGEMDACRTHVDRVLAEDPYRESAWRLAMRAASALGHDDRVIALYRDCRDRLAELPTEPSASTRRLLTELRR